MAKPIALPLQDSTIVINDTGGKPVTTRNMQERWAARAQLTGVIPVHDGHGRQASRSG